MSPRPPNELLYDSEATLRLVDSAIEDIRELEPRGPDFHSNPARWADARDLRAGSALGSVDLSDMIGRGYDEVVSVLGSLRESRSVLARTAGRRTTGADETLRDVASATGAEATDTLNGLDHAVALVNAMDTDAQEGDAADRAARRRNLGDELLTLASCVTGQDITAPRLSFASAVLAEIEIRLAALATRLDLAARALDRPTR